eukprot:CFRG2047T1
MICNAVLALILTVAMLTMYNDQEGLVAIVLAVGVGVSLAEGLFLPAVFEISAIFPSAQPSQMCSWGSGVAGVINVSVNIAIQFFISGTTGDALTLEQARYQEVGLAVVMIIVSLTSIPVYWYGVRKNPLYIRYVDQDESLQGRKASSTPSLPVGKEISTPSLPVGKEMSTPSLPPVICDVITDKWSTCISLKTVESHAKQPYQLQGSKEISTPSLPVGKEMSTPSLPPVICDVITDKWSKCISLKTVESHPKQPYQKQKYYLFQYLSELFEAASFVWPGALGIYIAYMSSSTVFPIIPGLMCLGTDYANISTWWFHLIVMAYTVGELVGRSRFGGLDIYWAAANVSQTTTLIISIVRMIIIFAIIFPSSTPQLYDANIAMWVVFSTVLVAGFTNGWIVASSFMSVPKHSSLRNALLAKQAGSISVLAGLCGIASGAGLAYILQTYMPVGQCYQA